MTRAPWRHGAENVLLALGCAAFFTLFLLGMGLLYLVGSAAANGGRPS